MTSTAVLPAVPAPSPTAHDHSRSAGSVVEGTDRFRQELDRALHRQDPGEHSDRHAGSGRDPRSDRATDTAASAPAERSCAATEGDRTDGSPVDGADGGSAALAGAIDVVIPTTPRPVETAGDGSSAESTAEASDAAAVPVDTGVDAPSLDDAAAPPGETSDDSGPRAASTAGGSPAPFDDSEAAAGRTTTAPVATNQVTGTDSGGALDDDATALDGPTRPTIPSGDAEGGARSGTDPETAAVAPRTTVVDTTHPTGPNPSANRIEQAPPPATTESTTPLPTAEETALRAEELAESLRATFRRGLSSDQLVMQLHPAELGTVRVDARVIDGVTHLVLRAESAAGFERLASSADQLRAELLRAGVDVGDLDLRQGTARDHQGRAATHAAHREGSPGAGRRPVGPTAPTPPRTAASGAGTSLAIDL